MNKKIEFHTWADYPNVKKLFDDILEHRRHCPWWKHSDPCKDCHYNTLTKIEKELGIND